MLSPDCFVNTSEQINALSLIFLGALLFESIMADDIKLGISSCLLGNKVRYDGGHKLDPYVRDTLGEFVQWVPVCPEVGSGLPVPREAMNLIGDPDSPQLVTILTGIDHTERIMRWVQEKLAELEKEGLCGFVFKARSPSCGVRDARIVAPSGGVAGQGAGLFAAAVVLRFPDLPVEDEDSLKDPTIRESFIERTFEYQRLRIAFRER